MTKTLALALLLLLAPTAFAQAPQPAAPAPVVMIPGATPSVATVTTPSGPPSLADTLTGEAKAAYESAKLLAANSDFQGALAKFEQAYELSKDPRLLYNMAICHKNLRAYARMETLLERYVHDDPRMPPDQRALVDAALAAIKGLVGTVTLTVTPATATVIVDGATVGTSPLASALLVDLGKHTLTVRKDGYDTRDKLLDVQGGVAMSVDLELTPTAHVATLSIASDEGATVAIDGHVVGSGRYRDKLPAGQHAVRVTEAGRVPFESTIDLSDGEVRTLEVTLKEEKHSSAWPWIVGGVALAAGAVVGGYFLFQPSNTTTPVPTGTIPDGMLTLKNARLR